MKTRDGLNSECYRVRLTHAVAAVAAIVAFCFLVGQSGSPPVRKVVGVTGGDRIIYRVYDTGEIEYIMNDLATGGGGKGVPDWSPLVIDATLTRDPKGNIRKK